MVLTSDIMDHR